MSGPRYRLTRLAERDLVDILRETGRQFGPLQQQGYADIIERAARMVAEQPDRPASRPRPDLAEGVRSFHLEQAAGRLGAAAHVLYYIHDAEEGVIIVRILHERMDPVRHF